MSLAVVIWVAGADATFHDGKLCLFPLAFRGSTVHFSLSQVCEVWGMVVVSAQGSKRIDIGAARACPNFPTGESTKVAQEINVL